VKTLVLVRHAKSSWDDAQIADRDRPLNKRGQRDAPMMGERLAQRGIDPERIISSPATRALATAQIIAEAIGYPLDEIVIDETLYGAGVGGWLRAIQSLDDELDCAMFFGHNPGLTDLVNHLSLDYIDNVPTCGIIELEYAVPSWTQVGRVKPQRAEFDYPKKGSAK